MEDGGKLCFSCVWVIEYIMKNEKDSLKSTCFLQVCITVGVRLSPFGKLFKSSGNSALHQDGAKAANWVCVQVVHADLRVSLRFQYYVCSFSICL